MDRTLARRRISLSDRADSFVHHEFPEGPGSGGECLGAQMDKVPVASQRKALDLQYGNTIVGNFVLQIVA